MSEAVSARRSRWAPAVALVLVALGVLATAARLDGPSDGTALGLGWSTWRADGVVLEAPAPSSGLRDGDRVTAVDGHRLDAGPGDVRRPASGTFVAYEVSRAGATRVLPVEVHRPALAPLLDAGWGNLVFVLALAGLAVALYLRRPDERATGPLLVLAAGLLASTFTVVAGLPVLALATGGPQLWLFHACAIGVYSVAWGATLAFSLTVTAHHPWLRRRVVLAVAYAAPLAAMVLWSAVAAFLAPDTIRWLGLVHSGQTAVVALTLLVSAVSGVVAYRADRDPRMRSRLRWVAGGAVLAGLLGTAGWHLPELVTGRHPLPWGALGLSALPFVAGIAVALRRHYLFDIERLANRSLVYAATVAVLVCGYAAMVALLVSGIGLSNTVAAALSAASAAVALAPLRGAAQGAVNRMMYGDRHDPAGALARLGTRLRAVMLPADVLPAVVETVARSLRVPYAGIELADGAGGFQIAAEHGVAAGAVHVEPLLHHGATVGRLRVSARGRDDPLDPVDLGLIGTLAQQVGTAVQAVRLHDDLLRSRAEVVALREDERRRLRRDLHDGLGPTLAAIGLKAGLAARSLPAGSPARDLLGEITAEAKASLADVRRLVEALRPPALDELGLVGAVRSRAATLAGELAIEVTGDVRAAAAEAGAGPAGDTAGDTDTGDTGAGDRDAGPLPAAVETAAFRIAVEAMTNAVRHSNGSRCTVAITQSAQGVEVAVRDDGGGLDPARAVGVGLRSMRERAAEVSGDWSIRTLPEGGTEVRAWLPTPRGG